jgi:hypothetical protein
MKLPAFILVLFIGIPGSLWAQSSQATYADFKGHFIGESIPDFLRLEPDAQQEADVCRARPSRRSCERHVGALDRGERAEVSNNDSVNFVLDAGRLVKLTMLVDDSFDAAVQGLTNKFGSRSKAMVLDSKNNVGQKWQNRQFVWDTPNIHVRLYQDNNPSQPDHRLLLIVESHAEFLLDDSDQAKKAFPSPSASNVTP